MNSDTRDSVGFVATAATVIALVSGVTSCGQNVEREATKVKVACIQGGGDVVAGNCIRGGGK